MKTDELRRNKKKKKGEKKKRKPGKVVRMEKRAGGRESVTEYKAPVLDSIAVSLFGNMTVEPREIHIITKE